MTKAKGLAIIISQSTNEVNNMSYVIYNKETTRLFSIPARSARCWTDNWASKGAATRAFNKAVREGKITEETHAIAEAGDFHANIELTETKKTIFGDEFTQPVNTPACCDPSTETYWSM